MESLLCSELSTPLSQQNYGKIKVTSTVDKWLFNLLCQGFRAESENKLKWSESGSLSKLLERQS